VRKDDLHRSVTAMLRQRAIDAVVDRIEQRELDVGKCSERVEREPAAYPRMIGSHDALHRITIDELGVVAVGKHGRDTDEQVDLAARDVSQLGW
jgi:hypothetical protein